MPSERLDALLRQRALLTQHLAWLDEEIARAAGSATTTTPAVPVSIDTPAIKTPPVITSLAADTSASAGSITSITTAPADAVPTTSSSPRLPAGASADALAAANARADEIIAQYSQSDRFDEKGAKRGCMLLAIAVFFFGLAAILGVYLWRYRQ